MPILRPPGALSAPSVLHALASPRGARRAGGSCERRSRGRAVDRRRDAELPDQEPAVGEADARTRGGHRALSQRGRRSHQRAQAHVARADSRDRARQRRGVERDRARGRGGELHGARPARQLHRDASLGRAARDRVRPARLFPLPDAQPGRPPLSALVRRGPRRLPLQRPTEARPGHRRFGAGSRVPCSRFPRVDSDPPDRRSAGGSRTGPAERRSMFHAQSLGPRPLPDGRQRAAGIASVLGWRPT